ncbi:SDR family oxidoreductase [Dactylosporangium sp. NPDC005572]|uniref:SDR family oxidoreductase n=1 Tax=Dactylosporangium sp. NPDC005572 TaxID=3156889 RepID=UPI0033AA876B
MTGAAAGIGRAYAIGLARAGAAVAVADINEAGAKETAALIEADSGHAVPFAVDISDRASTLRLGDAVRDQLGNAHIVVNNAAIFHKLEKHPLLTVDIGYWRNVFSVNLDGALLVTQAFAPQLISNGWGRVIVQTSTAAYTGPGMYGATKLALLALIRGFAKELGGYGVTVNGIAPGATMTDAMLDTVPQERLGEILAAQVIKRHGSTDDLVGPLLFLCSDAAAWVTGQTLLVDGGATPRL